MSKPCGQITTQLEGLFPLNIISPSLGDDWLNCLRSTALKTVVATICDGRHGAKFCDGRFEFWSFKEFWTKVYFDHS